jgi:DnaK suppressor protein
MKKTESASRTTAGGLTTAALGRYRTRLKSELRAAADRLERTLQQARALDGTVGDEADRAVEGAEQTRLFTAARKERGLVREIERALEKIDQGAFGICEGTGEPIEPRRLEAWPWSRYSRSYLEQLEAGSRAA